MAGIYIHIPFCKAKCHYCNFFSVASEKHRPQFVANLLKEINLQRDYLGGQEVQTIYLGGGTPSLLSRHELDQIFEALYAQFSISDTAEISLEANPDDISSAWVKEIVGSKVNRLSIGVQSFFDEDLAFMNRIHSGDGAREAIMLAQEGGINNLSIDLIYGIPGLTEKRWQKNLEEFHSLNIPHLSSYALTVEHKTALDVLIRKKRIAAPEEIEAVAHFKALQGFMERNGYIHYEISNFAREGSYSRHNSLYWTGGHYLGLGPSAHSYNGHSRRWNKASMKDWFSLSEFFNESFDEEILSHDQRYNEYVMTSLRTIWGCDLRLVQQEFGLDYLDYLTEQTNKHIADGMLFEDKKRIFLTPKGKLFADGIASDLFK